MDAHIDCIYTSLEPASHKMAYNTKPCLFVSDWYICQTGTIMQ